MAKAKAALDMDSKKFAQEIAEARSADKALMESPFGVVSAVYVDPPDDRVVLTLRNGVILSIPRRQIWELDGAPPEKLHDVVAEPLGDGLYWEAIDVSISTQGLLADMVGAIDARSTGRIGGSKKSERKTAAVRENGKKGGRPRRVF